MRGEIRIDFAKICPVLKSRMARANPLVIRSRTETCEGEPCEAGGKIVMAEIVSDSMLKSENADIEVSCEGCEPLPDGFTETVTEKIGI